MGDGALGSDHINYLIIRYLQEAGHENAAKALHQDWNRPEEYLDPEKLPFAAEVKQFELVNIIQDGLFYDQLTAQVNKQSPRFNLVQRPLESSPQQHHRKSSVENDTTVRQPKQPQPSRRRSSQIQRERVEQDDFPLPAPKRSRKSNGDDSATAPPQSIPLVNGHVMEVDSKTPQTTIGEDADEVDTDRAMSEAIDHSSPPSRPVVDVASAGTQTEKNTSVKKSETVYWSVENEHANILNALWSPRLEVGKSMLVVGDSVCRFYQVPEGHDQSSASNGYASVSDMTTNNKDPRNALQLGQTNHFDVENMPKGSIATAACWHPTGNYATCSLEKHRSEMNPNQRSARCLFDTKPQGGAGSKRPYSDNAYIHILQGQSNTLTSALRWNREGSLLLSVSMNLKRGLLEIWRDPNEEPIAVKIFSRPVFDAVWTSNDSLVICGEACLESYQVTIPPQHKDNTAMTNGDSKHSPTENLILTHSYSTDRTWEKIRHDALHNVVVAVSSYEENELVILSPSGDGQKEYAPLAALPAGALTSQVSALAFEHEQERGTLNTNGDMEDIKRKPRRLATAHHSGIVNIFGMNSTSCSLEQVLHLNERDSRNPEAALALSWSPDGLLLAVASEEGVKVWDMTSPASSNSSSMKQPIFTWKANPEYWGQSSVDVGNTNGVARVSQSADADADGDEMMDDDNGVRSSKNGEEDDIQIINEPALAWDAEGTSFVFALGRRMAVVRLLP